MSEMISKCGLLCNECPGYIATKEDDNQKRAKIAADWSKQFNTDIKSEDINCDGCTAEGRHIGHCLVCEIRKCSLAKSADNCGRCSDYACEKLDFIFKAVPDAKSRLDQIHLSLQG